MDSEPESPSPEPQSPVLMDDDDPPEGSVCEVSQYESIFNSRGERVLLRMGARRQNRDTQRDKSSLTSALVLTKFWDRDKQGSHTKLDIQSPYMKAALKECIPEFSHVDIEHTPIIIQNEPYCIFHYHRELFEYGQRRMQNREYEAGRHVQYLTDYMASKMISEIYMFDNMVANPSQPPAIDFPNLWMVFVPGDMFLLHNNIAHRQVSTKQILKFKNMNRCPCPRTWCQKSRWEIVGHFIRFNGKDFGHHSITSYIKPYDGFRALTDLPIMPLKYHPDRESIKQELVSRGKRFRDLSIGRHHMDYKGVASLIWGKDEYGGHYPRKCVVGGRIMADSAAFYDTLPDEETGFDSNAKIFRTELNHHIQMTDDELLICEDEVKGFSLNEMKWGSFKVDRIDEIKYDEDAFESLIFDQDYKDMVLSLVKVHTDERAQCDDIITGKGKGMIFLLHGETGVGKTLTAESVADYTRKPLLRLQSGILGSTAEKVEYALSEAFELAAKWDAVALLDEADVYLEQRDSINLDRNCLVSVFLCTLEYYPGILFLTTNRISSFDRAFRSRVHLAIHYPPLDASCRQRLWELFVSRLPNNAGTSLVESGDLKFLDDDGMNGRQIKNIVRTAHSLVIAEGGQTLGRHHLQKALKTMKFNMDFGMENSESTAEGTETTRTAKRRRLD
ncbi:P-loop containing nucleoside triphosphate hydrolase protein [Hypoxylon sp. EC38]|nr:P-loop containing nucleoside triphosphate hydrolase protein [Hypoxylon sp. EC38]